MTPLELSSRTVERRQLAIGPLVAEGGEGRVYELVDQPDRVFKAYRAPVDGQLAADLVAWLPEAVATQPELAARVEAATAWPTTVVVGPPTTQGAVGLLMPRAPRRFALRHRDGVAHLATLSYLTADPRQRAVAYGLRLPRPVAAERVGLVYSLARVLEAFEAASPQVGHGDLSTKNVLWSLQRGPEVYLLDCDNSERYDRAGHALGPAGRRRAMTPNWDDPAVGTGANPGLESDRYSLALVFLRLVGAAHFPIQKRQKAGERLSVDFEIPAGLARLASLDPGAALWDLCERGLGVVDPPARPAASEWVGALEALLDDMGAMSVVRSVWANQGGQGRPAATPVTPPSRADPARSRRDVAVQPQAAAPRPVAPPPSRIVAPPTAARRPESPAIRLFVPGPGVPVTAAGPTVPLRAQLAGYARVAAAWWLATHRAAGRALRSRGRRGQAVGRLAFCAVVDLVTLTAGTFFTAMIVSPFLGR